MNEEDLAGTMVLERLASIGQLDAFYDAVDADDIDRVTALLRRARVHQRAIATVVDAIINGDTG